MADEARDIRLPFMVSKTEAEAIDEWRYANRVPTRAEAMRRLVEIGLAAHGLDDTIATLSARAFALNTTDDIPEHVEVELEAIAEALDDLRKALRAPKG
jgi:hypothetical protein